MQPPNRYPRPSQQLAIQCIALIAVLSLAWPYFGLRNEPLPWPSTALAIGLAAWATAALSRQPWWWQLIHAAFAPLSWAFLQLQIPPIWFLAAFILTLLFFRSAATGQIPLYLTNQATTETLSHLLRTHPCSRFADLGAGIASTIAPLGRMFPTIQFTGIENALASWSIGRLRTSRLQNVDWQLNDFWGIQLSEFDVVYAFLSPAPMVALWKKAQAEMRPGSLLISNTFAIPDVDCSEEICVGDPRDTRLYCYGIAAKQTSQIKDEPPAA